MSNREVMQQALEALNCTDSELGSIAWKREKEAMNALKAALAEPQKPVVNQQMTTEPVAWRDHVEQRLLNWRQRFVNRSGDQLALDDFMDQQSIDDLIDYVCDEYTHPAPQRQPLTDEEIAECLPLGIAPYSTIVGKAEIERFARAIEAAHGITGETK